MGGVMAYSADRDFRSVATVTSTGVDGCGEAGIFPSAPSPRTSIKGADAASPVRQSARRGSATSPSARGRKPLVPTGEVWLDCDVAEYLHVERRTVQRIMKDGPRPGELDLRRANPVFVGDRRWFADNVRALMREGVAMPKEGR